jgi:threonyl-tRNA synthetase
VKHITQDDAHVFVAEDQIQDEIARMVDFTRYLYDLFGLVPRAELSTRRRSGSGPTISGTAPRARSSRR